MKPVEPLLVADRYAALQERLLLLLDELAPADWDRPVPGSRWRVRDVVAHLLDTDLRRLSYQRDRHPPPPPDFEIAGAGDLVRFLDQLNAEWVRVCQRLSPRLLKELIALAAPRVVELFRDINPFAPALFPVAWAGEESSRHWFDLAREYTEKWLHQQQIREAAGRPGLDGRDFLYPVLDTFLRALPFAYRDVAAEPGTAVTVDVAGDAGGRWTVVRGKAGWDLHHGAPERPDATVRLDQDVAWRLFATRRRKAELVAAATIEGDRALGAAALELVAVMA